MSDPTSLSQLLQQAPPLVLVLTDFTLAEEMPMDHLHQVLLLANPGSQASVR